LRISKRNMAQLLESYAGRGPIEFWILVERSKLFVEMRNALCRQLAVTLVHDLERSMSSAVSRKNSRVLLQGWKA